MKTIPTMMLALIGAGACSFFFGLGQHEVLAQVQNCQLSCCEDMYSWWINGIPGGTQCYSAQVKGATYPFGPGTNTTNAIVSVWVPVPSNPQNCKLMSVGNFDRWIWPSNLASCKNADGTYPSPQGVSPKVPLGGKPKFDKNVNQNVCTPSHS